MQVLLAKLELPSGYELKYAGQKDEQDKATASLIKAFITALLLVTLVFVPCLYVMVFRVLDRFGLGGLKTADEKAAEKHAAALGPEEAAAPAE